jgi:hypothetical protein
MQKKIRRGPIPLEILTMLAIALSVFGFNSCSGPGSLPSVGERVLGIEELTRLDLLPRLKQSVRIGCVSSFDPTGEDIFGSHHIALICDMPSAGDYKISIKAVRGPDQGILRMFQRDLPVGEAVNLFAEDRSVSEALPLGIQDMKKGNNLLFLHLVGKDARSKGLGLDLVEIIFERIK